MTTYAAAGNYATANRIVNAENSFIECLMTAASITHAEAEKVLAIYRKSRAVKLDAVGGTLTVKHGAFWDRDVILRALASA